MFINTVASYLPEQVITNAYFEQLNGLTDEWIIERTGIRQRRKASSEENTNTMAVMASLKGLESLPYDKNEIDLIVGATYTPYDVIATVAHAVQHAINVPEIPVVSISSACSSLLNAIEIVQGYFAMNKAKRALVVVSEHNTAYNNEDDTKAGHLWGDGAAALFISKERLSDSDWEIKDVITGGAGTIGKAMEGVTLKPLERGLIMPYGKDVFINACTYMPKVSRQVLERNSLDISDISYIIPHQANLRITKNVAGTLQVPEEKMISNIQYLGNTGCAGCAIALDENKTKFQKGEKVVITVFGGGYSYGAMLLEV
ncbi:3-oxoacyl-[acyl-carrier-protein] synthase-3 [Pseudarcicella hirudinis]|uniref:3-oxoacyl-[acyl-carrier-protein] synthase-3 n=1 Tax=Pseudarcicella hirudinis TaxID=1079859 RepID=A0A1I5U789_9BACT|nr:ketoacyl-ACP synthase III [Pseudarcicella hirudinis]SFP91159.1 3-oxoacyl-[acyl-carrier-protein] synthase-3 [Pseudarcicella hirudinis]